MSLKKEFIKGFYRENPVTVMALGLCPVLAVTASVETGLGMGVAATFVLFCSNIIISLIRKIVPKKIRIPIFITVIASFVTITEMVMQAYSPALFKALGIFVPLIVVNCIILGRAEAFASKNNMLNSMVDALGMGIGFTFILALLGGIRELLGNGTLLNISIFGSSYEPVLMMILPPGGFLGLGLIMAFFNWLNERNKK